MESEQVSRAERFAALVILGAAFLLRLLYASRADFDSDEPQHLHIAWAQAHGLMQYRDVFNHHPPLFYMLWSLPVRWIGDRPDLVILMRLTMLPLLAVTLWCVYRIASHLFSKRAGLWSAVCAASLPLGFKATVECRTDNLWTMFSLLSMTVLLGGELTPLRSLAAGLFMGAAGAVTQKTAVLVACMGLAWFVIVAARAGVRGWGCAASRHAGSIVAGLLGFAAIPSAFAAWFYSKSAFLPFYYGIIQHNYVPGTHGAAFFGKMAIFALAIILLFSFLRRGARQVPLDELSLKRSFLYVFTGVYIVGAGTLIPFMDRTHVLPVLPFVAIAAIRSVPRAFSACAARLRFQWLTRLALRPNAAACALVLLQLGYLGARAPWFDQTGGYMRRWTAVLRLTHPSEYVLDKKGELLFRRRAFFYTLEPEFGMRRLELGLIKDDIVQRLIETRCCIVAPQVKKLPASTQDFIEKNYVRAGPLLVAGQPLRPTARHGARPVFFRVRIPAEYCIMAQRGPAKGRLDGSRYAGPRLLAAGRHEFRPDATSRDLTLVWTRAIECGYRPTSDNGRSP